MLYEVAVIDWTSRRVQLTLRGTLLSWLRFEGRFESIDNTRSNFHLHQWLVKVLDTLEILDAGFAMLQITFVPVLTLWGMNEDDKASYENLTSPSWGLCNGVRSSRILSTK
jgi:hypothetical protein